jgi:hypothetical protein
MVKYMNQKWSYRTIEKETGVSDTTLWRIVNEGANVSDEMTTSIRNAFNRQAYSRLRDVGLSSYEANRWRWYTPNTVMSVESTMSLIVDKWSYGVALNRLARLSVVASDETIASVIEEAKKDVLQGISESGKPFEYIVEGDT